MAVTPHYTPAVRAAPVGVSPGAHWRGVLEGALGSRRPLDLALGPVDMENLAHRGDERNVALHR